MNRNRIVKAIGVLGISLVFVACNLPTKLQQPKQVNLPEGYALGVDSINTANRPWREVFSDSNLIALIDTALVHNQELNITLMEINKARFEIGAKKGEYLPSISLQGGGGFEKVGRFTVQGATEATTEIKPGEEMPDPVPDVMLGAYARWEVDIWNKLHNAKHAAVLRYLSGVEGRHFMVTNLVAEIANSYYELVALDNELEILNQNIGIQQNALKVVRLQKEAAMVTELAVRRFEAEVLKNQSRVFDIKQQIIEAENKINFLVGRFPQHVTRDSNGFLIASPDTISQGLPSQLLLNRPDVLSAELQLKASRLDVKVARANFYPSLSLRAGLGYQAFNPKFLLQTPQSMLYGLAGELSAPLINRKALKAAYRSADAGQVQAIYNYQQTVLSAFIEVENQLSRVKNLNETYALKALQVEALSTSIDISQKLFKSARADYREVLLTQRDALEAKFELVETRKLQLNARVNMYRALGGGWK